MTIQHAIARRMGNLTNTRIGEMGDFDRRPRIR